jgi:hypothetical protein
MQVNPSDSDVFLYVEPFECRSNSSLLYSILLAPSDEDFYDKLTDEKMFEDIYVRSILGSKELGMNEQKAKFTHSVTIEDLIAIKNKQIKNIVPPSFASFDSTSPTLGDSSLNRDGENSTAIDSLFAFLTALVYSFPHVLLHLFVSPSFDPYFFSLLFLSSDTYASKVFFLNFFFVLHVYIL